MKQTAVQYAVQWLTPFICASLQQKYIDELLKQAKEMEKEQMKLIYDGLLQNIGTIIKKSDLPTFEQYYNETYGGNNGK
jgi:hypothetical protein